MISFRPMTEADFALMHTWLCRPHVVEWWAPTPTLEEVREDYLPHIPDGALLPVDAPSGTVVYFAYRDGKPFGYIQAYRVMAHQKDGWWLDETDPNALGIDQFIGEAELLNQGLGTEMVRAFVAQLFEDRRVTKVQTDPDPENARAIACYRKAGFRDVGPVVTLDGPALLMVVDR
jgi:RimJ/RimL family protein N-acetyltransferase